MPRFDYGYDFDFPRGYHPGDAPDASDYYFCEKTYRNYLLIIQGTPEENKPGCVFHVKGELQGKPLILEKWQRDIIAAAFCLFHKETGLRRYSEVFIYVPRKNGKSLLCSALILAYLILDREKGKEVVSVASSEKQASLIYTPIRLSLKEKTNPLNSPKNRNPNNRFKVLANPRQIISENELNIYRPLTADGDANHGLNIDFSVMDEMHAWPQKKGQLLYEAIESSGGTRQNPLNIIITTADFARDSMCNDKFSYALDVAQQKEEDSTFLPILYYLDATDDWKDPENWAKCNPQLGKSIPHSFYEKKIRKAEREASYANTCKRLYFNISTQSETKFLDFAKWKKLEDKSTDYSGETCYGGLDLAFKNDMCAFILEFPGEKRHVISRFWIPEGHPKIEFYRAKGWIDSGEITVTDGNGIDFKKVKEDIIELCDNYYPVEIGYDPRFATEMCTSLYEDYNLPMIEVQQNARLLSEPLKDIETGIVDDKFTHDGNACMTWQIGNATSKENEGGLIMLVKPKGADATIKKVDGIAAFSMAHSRLMFHETNAEDLINDDNYSFF